MGIFDRLFKKQPQRVTLAPTMSGYVPIYPQMGSQLYECDVIQQALKCIVDEVKKVNPLHVRYIGNDPTPQRDSTVQHILDEPNPLMTSSEFFEKITWLLLLNYNAFAVPVYDEWIDSKTGQKRRYYKEIYPIKPLSVDFLQDASGRLFVKFWFLNGENTTLPYEDVVHFKYNYSVNTYMGGNELGQPDTAAIMQTANLNAQLLNGVAKAMNASYAINGFVKYNTFLDTNGTAEAVEEFNRKLQNNESGFVPMDMKSDIQPFERKTALVDDRTLKFVDEKLLRNFGVPLAILTGDYTKEQHEAFFQTLEPLIKSMSQTLTKTLFTGRERGFGNRIELYPRELVFMTVEQKLKLIEELAPSGALFENEKRTLLGLSPLPELEGKRYMSLNWIDANNATQYQIGKENVEVVDEEKDVM